MSVEPAVPVPVPSKIKVSTVVTSVGWLVATVLAGLQAHGYLTAPQAAAVTAVVEHHQPHLEAELERLKALLEKPVVVPAPVVVPTPVPHVTVVTPPLIGEGDPTNPLSVVKPKPPKPYKALKIVVSDEAGKPVTATDALPGQLLMVTASEKAKVAWSAAKHGDVRLLVLPDNAGFAFSLQSGSDVQFFLTDSSLKTTTVLMVCGPRPPPAVTPPQVVVPTPEPPVVVVPVPVTPVPVPVTPPVVTPVTPAPLIDDPTGLIQASHAGKQLVKVPQRQEQAAKIAKAHRDAATAFLNDTNPFSLVNTMEKAVTASIKSSLTPAEITPWVAWSERVATQMTTLQESGAITSREDWAEAYLAIASGLELDP